MSSPGEYGLALPDGLSTPTSSKCVTLRSRQNSFKRKYTLGTERKRSGEIIEPAKPILTSYCNEQSKKLDKVRSQALLTNAHPRKQFPQNDHQTGRATQDKINREGIVMRPVSGVSSCDDSQIREFKQKVKQNRELLKQQRQTDNQTSMNPDYFSKSESQKLKVLVNRQVAKVKRQLSLGSGYGSCRKLTPWVIASGNEQAKKQFRSQMYGRLSEYVQKKSIHSKRNHEDRDQSDIRTSPLKVTSQKEILSDREVKKSAELPATANKQREHLLIYPFPQSGTFEKPRPTQPQSTTASQVLRLTPDVNYLDFKTEFERFNSGMLRTQRYMEELLQNSLVLVELQTEIRYRSLSPQQRYGELLPTKLNPPKPSKP